jgi:hypothetical protein
LPDFGHLRLSYLVPFYFDRPGTFRLTDLLKRYAEYSVEILDVIQFVFIDDGSPIQPDVSSDLNLNLLLLRIREDIPWNQPGARNLGAVYARSDKMLMTDLAHEFSEETLRYVVKMKNPGRTMYKLRRVRDEGEPCKPHPNTFVLSRWRFLRLFGYDEAFCGHYGFDDAMFWRWQRNHGTRFRYLPRSCVAGFRALLDERGHSLPRDLSHNKVLAMDKRKAWKQYGPNAGHSRLFLNFTWDVVLDLARDSRPVPIPDPLWTRTGWWRWMKPGS